MNKLGLMGSQVIVPYRGDDYDCRHLKPMGDLGQIMFYPYHLLDYEAVKKLCKYSNVVINLVGQDNNSRHFNLDDVHVSGARVIARAAAEAGVGRLIHVSALNADTHSPSQFYRSKAFGEKAVLDEFPDATILRPSLLFGAEDRTLGRLADYIKLVSTIVPMPDGGNATKQMVYVGDLAEAIVQSISHAPGTYEIVGPKTQSLQQLATFVSDMIRVPHRSVPVPSPLIMFAAGLMELSPLDPFVTREEFHRYITSDKLSGLPGLAELGITPSAMDKIALSYLRRYRRHVVHDEILQG